MATRLIERSVFIEPLLAYPGLGLLALNAIINADVPLALATLTLATLYAYAVLTIAEVVAARLDPRV